MASAKLKPDPGKKYRLITRSDMDGLVCAVLLRELEIIDDISFAHPKDMQDGLVDVDDEVITTNLPYAEGVYMAFDHHASEVERAGTHKQSNHIIVPSAPSAARVVYDYFGGADAFPNVSEDMMSAVDKADAAQFSKDDILNPQGWELLSFIMDARTGLGRFRDFNISNYQLMMKLIDTCRDMSIKDILALPDVKERVDLYKSHDEKAREQIKRCAKVEGNLVVLDLRNEETIWAANRFLIYALFPKCNISMHVMWGKNKQNTVLAIGKSILDRSSKTHVGELCLKYGGGGHNAAGTCQVDNLKADEKIAEIAAKINKDG
jgi:nanoRNase/pAp phosphatase (c-di-AMP/oligoRNAs hydrolase)